MTEDKRDRTLFNKVRIALYNQARDLAVGYFHEIGCTFNQIEHPEDRHYPYIAVDIRAGVVCVTCTVSFKQDLKSIYSSGTHLHVRGEKTISVSEVALISAALAAFERVAKGLRNDS